MDDAVHPIHHRNGECGGDISLRSLVVDDPTEPSAQRWTRCKLVNAVPLQPMLLAAAVHTTVRNAHSTLKTLHIGLVPQTAHAEDVGDVPASGWFISHRADLWRPDTINANNGRLFILMHAAFEWMRSM